MDRNICKFIMPSDSGKLLIHHFVYETNKETALIPYEHNSHCAYLALSSGGKFIFNKHEEPIKKGTLYFAFPGEAVHAADIEEPEYMYIGFTGGRVPELLLRFGITPTSRSFAKNESLIPFWKESLARADDMNIDLVSESVLLYTFSKLVKSKSAADDAILRIIKYIEDNFQDPRLTLSSAAEACKYHPKYLSHRFKEYAGVGFSSYLKNIRIKHALLLFDHKVDSVKNVSLLCGFDDPLYFSKVFKETVGVSPREYLSKKKTENHEEPVQRRRTD